VSPRDTALRVGAEPVTSQADQPAHSGRSGRGRAARWLIVLVLIAAAVAFTVANQRPGSRAAYHPANPGPLGAQALARVLADHGVEVTIAEGEKALRAAAPDDKTTVVVSSTTALREPTERSFLEIVRPAERVVLIAPDRANLRRMLPQIDLRVSPSTTATSAECDLPDVHRGEQLSRIQTRYLGPAAGSTCFTTSNGYAGYLKASVGGLREVVLVGTTDLIVNSRITEAANAAIALRILGHSARLIWYVPDVLDAPVTTAAQGDDPILPPWLGAMVLMATVAVLALMWWRGRRLGRLVQEPLPVLVRAVETTEHRARLYRKAADNERASAVLRDATRRRVTAYLGLPPGTPPALLIEPVAHATGRTPDEVGWLLGGAPAATETEMLGLAAALAALEKEIRRR
jgi:hypothetical protein